MKLISVKTYIGSLFVLLISMSLTISTLHSHNHIDWHHPQKHVDTGSCLTIDSTQCPICGYLFNADITRTNAADVPNLDPDNLSFHSPALLPSPAFYRTSGRSPPVLI